MRYIETVTIQTMREIDGLQIGQWFKLGQFGITDCRAKHPRNTKARQECDQPNRRVEIILHGEKAE